MLFRSKYARASVGGFLTSQGIIESMFQDIITNGTDVKKAAKTAEKQLNELFSTVQQ